MNALSLRLNHGSAYLFALSFAVLVIVALFAGGVATFAGALGLESTLPHDALLFGATCWGWMLGTSLVGFALAACIERPGR